MTTTSIIATIRRGYWLRFVDGEVVEVLGSRRIRGTTWYVVRSTAGKRSISRAGVLELQARDEIQISHRPFA